MQHNDERSPRRCRVRSGSVVMRGVEYRLETIASYLAHGHPDLSGKLELLDPIQHQEFLRELTEAVARGLWHEHRCLSRDTRLQIAEDVVYFGCADIYGMDNSRCF